MSHLATLRISSPPSIPFPGAVAEPSTTAGNGASGRASSTAYRAEVDPCVYPMRYSIPVSDAFISVFIQEDAQTRSSNRAHAGKTPVVSEPIVTRRRRHRNGHGAGAEVTPVATRSDGAQADDSLERGNGLAGVIDSLRTALVNVYD
jgi:hypothetical protein